ncbi:hypothetical protein ACIBO9_05670 [Streptomyces prunicolor]|uniref:hypothetical protein n=1 Tax=Streptomyces prunicolor TaxID=67348 RepID=UPI0037D8B9AC
MAYRSLLRIPGATFFPLGFLARLPYATSSLATLVLVQAASGSYAFAGLAAAAQGCVNALGGPLVRVHWSRLLRTRDRPDLLPTALSYEATVEEISFALAG